MNVFSDPSLEIRLSLRISFVFVHCLHEECPMKEGEVLLLRVASGADRQTHVWHTRAPLAHLPCPSTCRQALRSRIPCSLRETTRIHQPQLYRWLPLRHASSASSVPAWCVQCTAPVIFQLAVNHRKWASASDVLTTIVTRHTKVLSIEPL